MSNYIKLKKLLQELEKMNIYSSFKDENIFYVSDETDSYAIIICKTFFTGGYGLQVFVGEQGLNTLSQLKSSPDKFDPVFADFISLKAVDKSSLSITSKNYLKENHARISNSNYLFLAYKEGFHPRFLKDEELELIIKIVSYLKQILIATPGLDSRVFDSNICKAIASDGKVGLVGFSDEVIAYKMPANKRTSKKYVYQLEAIPYGEEELYLTKTYSIEGIIENKNFLDTMLIIGTFKDGNICYNEISYNPENIFPYIMSYLIDIFNQYGLPHKLVIGDAKLFALTYKTLHAAGIDVVYDKNNVHFDDLIYAVFKNKYQDIYQEIEQQDLETTLVS